MIAPGIFLLLFIVYLFVIRPWHMRWGATDIEVKLALPGDEIVARPEFNGTRAISIAASPEEIWKWIVQIGSNRAGWYSIDWIDNGGKASSKVILSEFQHIEKGQFIPFTPDQKNGMWVKEFELNKYILWIDKSNKATWLWYIYTDENSHTRLVTRLRTKYNWRSLWVIYYLVYDVGDIVMMKKCMKGIRQRAESNLEKVTVPTNVSTIKK